MKNASIAGARTRKLLLCNRAPRRIPQAEFYFLRVSGGELQGSCRNVRYLEAREIPDRLPKIEKGGSRR